MRFKFFILLLSFSSLFAIDEAPWGKDSDLIAPLPKKQTEAPRSLSLAGKMMHGIIHFHQKVLSPAKGPTSNFRPTSSRYMELAIQNYGFFRGFVMGCDRLLRENNEEWIYRTIDEKGVSFKFDPAIMDKETTDPNSYLR
ncbi:MAG TPA: membrane protein insertion efficiency factor YidD [Chlamydiales bacterium]|nr:membrane protein insertion efficiency factor YidD [Chlamydiales bacterium]